jgi:hypothetical protein
MKSVISDGMHYIRHYADGREELYDLRTDLDELNDVATADPARLQRYRELLDRMLLPSDKKASR